MKALLLSLPGGSGNRAAFVDQSQKMLVLSALPHNVWGIGFGVIIVITTCIN